MVCECQAFAPAVLRAVVLKGALAWMCWALPESYVWSGHARVDSGPSPQVRSCSLDSHLQCPQAYRPRCVSQQGGLLLRCGPCGLTGLAQLTLTQRGDSELKEALDMIKLSWVCK